MTDIVVLLLLGNVALFFFYLTAGNMRVRVLQMRGKNPLQFRLLGFGKSYLDDEKTWVRRYRIFIAAVCIWSNLFGLWLIMTLARREG